MHFEIIVRSEAGEQLAKIVRSANSPTMGHFESPLSEEGSEYILSGFELKPISYKKKEKEPKTELDKAAEKGFNS